MAFPSITSSDFTGVRRISTGIYQAAENENIISDVYPKFVRRILSDEAFIEIRDTDPLPQKYLDLFNGVSYYDADLDKTLIHDGLKDVCIGVCYFEIVRLAGAIHTATGVQKNMSGNAMAALNYEASVKNYNASISSLCERVYPYIRYYEEIREAITSSVDNGGGAYTINVNSTLYLSDGDNVTINSQEYTVANLVANTSFDISGADTGLDFSGSLAIYEPFKDYNLPNDLYVF